MKNVFSLLFVFIFLLSTVATLAQSTSSSYKRTVIIKTARKYNGIAVDSIVIKQETHGISIHTVDGKIHSLAPKETKQIFDINLTANDFRLPHDASATYYDENGVPSDVYQNENYAANQQALPFFLLQPLEIQQDTTKKPLWFINGKEVTAAVATALNPDDIDKVNVLNRDSALQRYGDRARDGAILIVLKNTAQSDTISNATPSTAALKDTIRATFKGGITAWRRYIERALKYPPAAQQNRTQGVIRVFTTIGETGKIISTKALNNPGDGLAEEAERVLKESPTWQPATVDGKPVPVSFVQKITFRLS